MTGGPRSISPVPALSVTEPSSAEAPRQAVRPAVRAVGAVLLDGDGDPVAHVRMVLSSALPPRVVMFAGRPYLLIGKVQVEAPTYQYSRPYLADGSMVTELSRARP